MTTEYVQLEDLSQIPQALPLRQSQSAAHGRSASVVSGRFQYRIVKRALDIALVILFIPIWFPVVCIVALAVHLDSSGAVLFSHRRLCQNGDFFSMWKFRTMCTDSAEILQEHLRNDEKARLEWSQTHKLVNDPRVTRVGYYLRRFSLDELPQLFNVLDGSMTLVGPRPITVAEIDKYQDTFDRYCEVKPGITGLWQTSGRSHLSYEERVQLDNRYVEDWSLKFDCVLLCRTILSVARSHGAV